MPISIEELDSSTREENITIILGKGILLKIIENSEKRNLLNNKVVKKFVSSPNLCHDDIRFPILELSKIETSWSVPKFMKSLLDISQRKDFKVWINSVELPSSVIAASKFYKDLEEEFSQTVKQKLSKIPKEELEEITSDLMYTLVGKIDEKLAKEENEKIIAIGDSIKERTGFDILVPSTLLLCPNCRVLLSTEEYRGSKKCYLCKNKIKRHDANRVYIHKLNDHIKKVLEKNLWFEAYMARLLRKLGYKTWTGVHVMGASGILHEIDVLAIRKGTVLNVECKTGKVSRNDVFNFCTKVGDLKSHVSILALIQKLPESETREFVKKNPAIIRLEDMGKRRESEIVNYLKGRLTIKA